MTVERNLRAKAALTFALDVGFTSNILKGEHLGVINAIRLRKDCLVSAGVFVVNIGKKAQLYNSVEFSFVGLHSVVRRLAHLVG